ncbi:MAG TPA: hypothetical protein VHH36_01230 [Candidatus Thermoplasmatota archaeon]|nr:hypothetical protein [Candidatus Thermoplasmatota archaeon]
MIRTDRVSAEGYADLLRALAPVFVDASMGDFTKPLPIPEEDSPYAPILVGVEIMRQVIQHQMEEVEALNRRLREANADLERKVEQKTLAIVQGEERLRRLVVARPMVRTMIRRLIDTASVSPGTLREFGEQLAADAQADDLHGFAQAFHAMGLGELSWSRLESGSYEFVARDLIERREGTRMTTCFLTSGFLGGATARSMGRPAVAGEVACQSRGDPECRFLARPKA